MKEISILIKIRFTALFDRSPSIAVSNPKDFNTHTSSKSTCWDGDMRETYKFYSELKILFKNLHNLPFLTITIEVCQIQMTLTLIPLQNEHDGWGYVQNTKILFRAEMIPRKHHSLWLLAITILVCQIQMILTIIPLQNQHVWMGICSKHTNIILSWRYCSKTFIIYRFWL